MTHTRICDIRAHVHDSGALTLATERATPVGGVGPLHSVSRRLGAPRASSPAAGRRGGCAGDPKSHRDESAPPAALEATMAEARLGGAAGRTPTGPPQEGHG